MIPKRAIFYWAGEEMSWLRKQSVESFRAFNPSWTVTVIEGPSRDTLIRRVHGSDISRYVELAQSGGMYFDTDIMFCRPIPEKWLEYDLLLPLDSEGRIGHVACLGAVPGSSLFQTARRLALESEAESDIDNYQGYGVDLLRRVLAAMSLGQTHIKWIAPDTFLIVPWFDVKRLWRDWTGPFPDMSVGVHWFGGDHLSMAMEPVVDEKWMQQHPKTLLAQAWNRSRCAEAETLREQHGAG